MVKLKRQDGHFDGRLCARHHVLEFTVSAAAGGAAARIAAAATARTSVLVMVN